MDYLKEGIGLRAMAQRDPLVEYQREGFDMFAGMLEGLKEESVGFLFNVSVEAVPATAGRPESTSRTAWPSSRPPRRARRSRVVRRASRRLPLRAKGIDNEAPQLTYTGPAEDGSAQVQGNGDTSQAGGGSRRDRREAARRQGKHARAKRR